MGFIEPIAQRIQSQILLVDSLVATVLAFVLYFYPHVAGDYAFQRKTDGVHWHLIRCVGAQILSTAFVNMKLRQSSSAAKTVCFLIRIISSGITLMLVCHCASQTPNLVDPQTLEYARVFSLWTVGIYAFNLIINAWPVGSSLIHENKIGNFLYQLDCLASMLIGLAWLTVPKWLLHRQVLVTLDESHELVARLMGAFFVCTFCISQHALHWKSLEDRKVVVDSRVVCCIGILGAQLWSQYAYHDDWSNNHWVGISLFSTWTGIAFIYRVVNTFFCQSAPKGKKA